MVQRRPDDQFAILAHDIVDRRKAYYVAGDDPGKPLDLVGKLGKPPRR
jgi:hypothetical protein